MLLEICIHSSPFLIRSWLMLHRVKYICTKLGRYISFIPTIFMMLVFNINAFGLNDMI